MAVEINHGDDRLARMDVDGQRDQALVQPDECRPAAALRYCGVAFAHPFLRQQLLDDLRHRAALQPRLPGELRARDRLLCPDQLENDVAVDPPRRDARCQLDVRQIEAANLARPLAPFHGSSPRAPEACRPPTP
jgi:hypothetical protein